MKFLMVYLTFREGKELYKTLNSYLLGSGYPSLERPLHVSSNYALLMDHRGRSGFSWEESGKLLLIDYYMVATTERNGDFLK